LGTFASTVASAPSQGWLTLYTLSALVASVVFSGSNLIFAFIPSAKRWMAVVQASEIAVIGLIAAIVSAPFTYGGIIVFALSLPLFAKYGAIRNQRTMLIVLGLAVVVDTVGSMFVHDAVLRLAIAMTAISAGVLAIVYFAFYDEIMALLKDVSDLRRTAAESEKSLMGLRRDLVRARIAHDAARAESLAAETRVHELEDLVGRIEAVATPVDFQQFELSEREIEVLRCLVQTRGRNQDIADMLGISERTVKSHIYRICNKVGLGTRLELVELFRWNWPSADGHGDSAR